MCVCICVYLCVRKMGTLASHRKNASNMDVAWVAFIGGDSFSIFHKIEVRGLQGNNHSGRGDV